MSAHGFTDSFTFDVLLAFALFVLAALVVWFAVMLIVREVVLWYFRINHGIKAIRGVQAATEEVANQIHMLRQQLGGGSAPPNVPAPHDVDAPPTKQWMPTSEEIKGPIQKTWLESFFEAPPWARVLAFVLWLGAVALVVALAAS